MNYQISEQFSDNILFSSYLVKVLIEVLVNDVIMLIN